jgi:chloramphenicol-sensitive protein RarD
MYALLAYGMWGLMPLYLRAVRDVPPLEVLAHRIVWSFVLLLGVLTLVGGFGWLVRIRKEPRIVLSFVASSALLSVNWFVYIWAVGAGRVIDASLGYFINPLLSVVLAVFILKERLRPLQWAAVAIAALGVLWLTVLAGQLPWIGLSLAGSFGMYGLLRKTAALDALAGLSLETLLLAPIALLFLTFQGRGAWPQASAELKLLLVAAGPVTALPLLCFSAGARRIRLSLLGILQYLGPSLQLALGVLVFEESFALPKLCGFLLIWLSLLVYSIEGLTFSKTQAGPV